MIKIIAASSPFQTLADLVQNLKAQLEDMVYSVPGFSLIADAMSKPKNVLN